MLTGCQKNQPYYYEVGAFSLFLELLEFHEEERGWRLGSVTNGQWFNQSCLCNEAHKTSEWWDSKSFWVGETVEMLGELCTWEGHGSSTLFLQTLPYSSHLSGCLSVSYIRSFYKKLVTISKLFLCSVSHSSWWIELKEGSHGRHSGIYPIKIKVLEYQVYVQCWIF